MWDGELLLGDFMVVYVVVELADRTLRGARVVVPGGVRHRFATRAERVAMVFAADVRPLVAQMLRVIDGPTTAGHAGGIVTSLVARDGGFGAPATTRRVRTAVGLLEVVEAYAASAR